MQRFVEVARGNHIASARVEEFDDGIALGLLVGSILHLSGEGGLVALTQESRQTCLDHERFLGEHLEAEFVGIEIGGVGHGLYQPGCVEVGCLELDGNIALGVGDETGHPQGRLDIVFAHLHLVEVSLIHFFGLLLIGACHAIFQYSESSIVFSHFGRGIVVF